MSDFELGMITGAALMFGALSGPLLQWRQLRALTRAMARSSRRWVRGQDFDRVCAQRDALRAALRRAIDGGRDHA